MGQGIKGFQVFRSVKSPMSIMDRNKTNYARTTDLHLNIYHVELSRSPNDGCHWPGGVQRQLKIPFKFLSQLSFEDGAEGNETWSTVLRVSRSAANAWV